MDEDCAGLLVVSALEFAYWELTARQFEFEHDGCVRVRGAAGTLCVVRRPRVLTWGSLVPAFGLSRCYRCRLPWSRWLRCSPREVALEGARGQFALCVRCWGRCGPGDRLRAHAYVTMVVQRSVECWPRVRAAVLRESGEPG